MGQRDRYIGSPWIRGTCPYDSLIVSRNASSPSPALMRSIMLSVVGEENTTGIVKIYDEERRASETYDISGRRLPAGSQRGLVIENGKVVFKK